VLDNDPDVISKVGDKALMQPPPYRSPAARRSASAYLPQRFVRQVGSSDGVAWCTQVQGPNAILWYTEIPGEVEEMRVVPVDQVRLAELPYQTRVWLPGKPFGWIPGEVAGRSAHGRVVLRVPGFGELRAEPAQFYVRWNRPLADPASAVAHGLSEGREFYDARQPLVRSIVQQRAAYKGFTAAASAPVLPFQHQLNVLSRVTSDPVMRFLLADEVGLGKTIEAGLVMRQILLDDPSANIAVLVPAALVSQWKSELSDRLALNRQLHRVFIAPHGALAEVASRSPRMLVIDEAHRMIEWCGQDPRRDQALSLAARSSQGLLLLTATPMHGGAKGFLRLLSLIDPDVYRLEDIGSFQRRLQMRQEQATEIELLRPGIPAPIILNILDSCAEEYSSDPLLLPLLRQARDSVAGNTPDRDASLTAVADHLRETYRISRRVIRQRRAAAETRGYPVSGRKPRSMRLHDPARPLLDDFLEDWRGHLLALPQGPQIRALFTRGAEHVLAGPGPAQEFIRSRLGGKFADMAVLDGTEEALLRNTAAALELRGTHARTDLVASHIAAAIRPGRKVLVLTSYTSQAHVLVHALHRESFTGPIALHTEDMTPSEREEQVGRFVYEPGCNVLIADASAAEGRNFQMADELINLDLPLSPSTLEQRIGRVDRFNLHARPTGTVCTYLAEPGSMWTESLLRFLKDIIGIFSQSVATLQRPLDDLENRVREQLLIRGASAMDIPAEETRQLLADEREQLDLLAEIEDAQLFSDFSDASFDDLLTFEDDSQQLQDAFLRLVNPSGGIGLQMRQAAPLGEIFEFSLPGARDGVLGLSADECAAIARLLPGRYAFDKVVAATRFDVRPVRIGNPVVDWLETYLRSDERGRCIALLTRSRYVSSSQLWLGFDFLLEFDDSALAGVSEFDRCRLRRRGDAFLSPRVETIWTDGASEAPPEIMPLLTTRPADGSTIEQVLRGRSWQEALAHFPDWAQQCNKASSLAREILRARPAVTLTVEEAAALAAAEAARRSRVLRARAMMSSDGQQRERETGDLARESQLAGQVDWGIRHPRTELLACTAIVLLPAGD
jgi:ATP-dependent helicase HepA